MSRPRSGRAASSAPARAASGGARGVYVPTAKNDVFTALLGVALAAMIIGCILLVLILKRYDFKVKVSATTSDPAPRSALAANAENRVCVRS